MTLKSLAVQNYQSLKDVNVDLGTITVIEGPSSTGKSALLRAFRTLARNGNAATAVAHGSTKASITATFDDCVVSLDRGKSLSTYTLNGEVYTKAGVSVPEPVEDALRMPLIEKQDLNFSFQFDPPFLLALSAGEIAKLLSTLTNAGMLNAAAKEANRRKLAANTLAKQRKLDTEQAQKRLDTFVDLRDQQRLLISAKAKIEDATAIAESASNLRSAVESYDHAQVGLEVLTKQLVDVPDVSESLNRAEELLAATDKLRRYASLIKKTKIDVQIAEEELDHAVADLSQIESEEKDAIHQLGVCPVCGQETANVGVLSDT